MMTVHWFSFRLIILSLISFSALLLTFSLTRLDLTDELKIILDEDPIRPDIIQSSGPIFKRHILKLWYMGKCLNVKRSEKGGPRWIVVVDYCNPNNKQTFTLLSNGSLVFDLIPALCVQYGNTSSFLGGCNEATSIKMVNKKLLYVSNSQCLSPVNSSNQITSDPSLDANVCLVKCHEEYSRIDFIPEAEYLFDRRALQIVPVDHGKCNHMIAPSCGTNNRPAIAKLLPPTEVQHCHDMSECVTLVIKTAKRPLLIQRLAESIKEVLGIDLDIIVVDDGPGDYPSEVWEAINNNTNIRYIISDDTDLGISAGRNLGMKHVKTKYMWLLDDDNVLNNKTDLRKMVDILDTTDASLVGGHFTDYRDFAGLMEIISGKKRHARLYLYQGVCTKLNRTIPNFPDCHRCDITANAFLAKTQDILDVGGWSEELKVSEHKDLFLRLKAAGRKVVSCPNIEVYNWKPFHKSELNSLHYYALRYGKRQKRMTQLFNNRWNLDFNTDVTNYGNKTMLSLFKD